MSLDNFRKAFGGIRSNRFRVQGKIPSLVSTNLMLGGTPFDIFVKATQIPGAAIGFVPMPWRGRTVKFAAERSFGEWAMQIYTSAFEQTDLRTSLIQWMDAYNDPEHTIMRYDVNSDEPIIWNIFYNDIDTSSASKAASYQSTPQSTQVKYNNQVILYNVMPIEVGPMEFNHDVTDAFAEFTLTLTYDYSKNIRI